MDESFPNRLRYAMSLRGMELADISYMTGIRKSRLKQYLNEICIPKSQAVHDMAMALSVSEEWLLGFSVPMDR